jgi:hypothetical protein
VFELPLDVPGQFPTDSDLLRIVDADGAGSAVLEIRIADVIWIQSIPASIFASDAFFDTTGSFESPPKAFAKIDAVPEPSIAALFAFGLAAIAIARRRGA